MPRFHRVKKESDKIPMSDYNLKSDYLEALANMKVTGGKFTISRAGASLDVTDGPKTLVYLVTLNEALNKPTSSNAPTTASATPLRHNSQLSGDGEPVGESDTESITVVNRDPDFEAESGKVIKVVRVSLGTHLEWQPATSDSVLPTDEDDPTAGFSGSCTSCGCIKGRTIPDGTVCCTSFLEWSFIDPLVGGIRKLQYAGVDVWVSDVFDGNPCECTQGGTCNCLGDSDATCANRYRWVLTPSLTAGSTLLELEIIENLGCPVACLKYKKRGEWQCQCNNELEITGDWANLGKDSPVVCKVCLSPVPQQISTPQLPPPLCGLTSEEMPLAWTMTPGGTFAGGTYNFNIPAASCKATTQVFEGQWTFLPPDGSGSSPWDEWVDLNIISDYPLVYQPGGSFHYGTPTPMGTMPLDTGVSPEGDDGEQNGVQVGEMLIFLGDVTYVKRMFGYCGLTITCWSTTDVDDTVTWSIQLTAHISTCGHTSNQIFFGNTGGIFGNVGNFGSGLISTTYTTTISGITYEDIPCQLNQTHTLTRQGPPAKYLPTGEISQGPAQACYDLCGDVLACDNLANDNPYFDPEFDDVFVPNTVVIQPFGNGPDDCPNPPLDDIPTDIPPDDSGACTTCTPDSTTEDPDDGSCCIDGICYQYVSEDLCTDFSGTMYANEEECADNCNQTSCCYPGTEGAFDLDCTEGLTQDECLALHAQARWAPASLCSTVWCQSFGACCDGIGDCTEDTGYGCQQGGGVFFNSGETCVTIVCDVLGSCCHKPDPACTGLCECINGVTEDECDAYCGGLASSQANWMANTTCSEHTCTNDTGNICSYV